MSLLVQLHVLGFLPQALSATGLVVNGKGNSHSFGFSLSAGISYYSIKFHESRYFGGTGMPPVHALAACRGSNERQQ